MSSSGSSRLRKFGSRIFRKKAPKDQNLRDQEEPDVEALKDLALRDQEPDVEALKDQALRDQEHDIEAPSPLGYVHFKNMIYETVLREEFPTNACRNMENFVYSPLPVVTIHIRLLRIQEVYSDLVTCSLETYPLSEVVGRFDALSYAWGTEAFTTDISCNGKKLSITPSLEEILRQLYTYQHRTFVLAGGAIKAGGQLFWIDAICLNQADSAEVAHHIPFMGQVYSEARSTFAYIGKGNHESNIAMDVMAPFNADLEKLNNQKNQEHTPTIEDTNHPMGHPTWDWYGDLYRRPWCERLWVLQEVVLAQNVLFGCGDRWVSGHDFFGFLRNLQHLGFGEALTMPSSVTRDTTPLKIPFQGVLLMKDTTVKLGKIEGMLQLLNLMYVTRQRVCREPTDRLWAILGLLGDKLQDDLRSSVLLVDILAGRKEYWETYLNLAQFCLLRDNRALGKLFRALYLSRGHHSYHYVSAFFLM